MASPPSPLEEVEDEFLECALCLSIFTDPKQLPCLHRYCRDCLHKYIEKGAKTILECPLCKDECDIPPEGADGFKTDFLIRNILEYIQLQKSFKEDDARVCVSCSKEQKAVGYCFKCTDFLCEKCHQTHLSSKMFTEHQQHILNLMNVTSQNLTLQKLASLTEDPRCHDHPKFIAQLCCSTCDNLPVCVTCTFSKHKGHDLHDVTEVAKDEKSKLKETLDELEKYKDRLFELQKKAEQASEALKENVTVKIEQLVAQHRSQTHKIRRKLKENDTVLEQAKADIIDTTKMECEEVQKKYEEKIAKLRAECKGVIEEKEKQSEQKTSVAQVKHDNIETDLYKKQEAVDGDLKSFQETIDHLTSQNEKVILEIADHSNRMINRYKNFTATTSTILASDDGWTDVRCIPELRAASKPLLRDIKEDSPGVESLSDITVGELPSVFDVKVTIPGKGESVLAIEGIRSNGWEVGDMASCGDDRIAITGKASDEYSFISVINTKGKILHQNKIREFQGSVRYPCLYGESLSPSQLIILCQSGQIGVYDVRDGSYSMKSINDLTSSWSPEQFVSCITHDSVTKTVFVGSRSQQGSDTLGREVLVFDEELNYRHVVSLPEPIRGSTDITVHDGRLVVCDHQGQKAHAVTVDGRKTEHVHEFTKPDQGGADWGPYRVCVDRHDHIYMMWDAKISGQGRRLLTQYSQDGRHLMRTIPVDVFPTGLCTIVTDDDREKLVLATWRSGQVHKYGLAT